MSEFIANVKGYFPNTIVEYNKILENHDLGLVFRIVLILVSLISVAFVLRKIRKNQLHIDDALFWIISSAALLVLSIFPHIAFFGSALLRIKSPTNFVFLVVIFVALSRVFSLAIELSIQKQRLNTLVQKLALANEKIEANKKKLEKHDKKNSESNNSSEKKD